MGLDDDKIIYEDAYKPQGKGIDRLEDVDDYFRNLIDIIGRRVNRTFLKDIIFAIEGYSFMSGKQGGYDRLTQAGELNAAIRLALHPSLCVIYPPKQHRSKSINYVGGDKKKIVELVNAIYGTDIKKHDIADAYSIAVALREDFTRLKNAHDTVLFDSFIKKTPFRHLVEGQLEEFRKLLKNE